MLHVFLWQLLRMKPLARRGDARFCGVTIGNWMFGVWHWPLGKRDPRKPLPPLDAGEP